MTTNPLRPVEPERDFARIAALFTREQDEPTTVPALEKDYDEHKDRIFRLMAAVDDHGALVGFNWATRSRFDPAEAYFYVIVSPERRCQGAGARLYADVEQAARAAQIHKLKVDVRDVDPGYYSFAARRGFEERVHSIGMSLDLRAFDPAPFNQVAGDLRARGFRFTSMQELGDTQVARRELYRLNDEAASQTMGVESAHPWLSFEDFERSVCGASWYIPAAQFVVIDTNTGVWAAMSAITRFEGADYAYNLFTGVDQRYRGRKLAQAVKALALQYARDVLEVQTVKTNHNARNEPMIAIDRKMGYVQTPGYFVMEKTLAETPNPAA